MKKVCLLLLPVVLALPFVLFACWLAKDDEQVAVVPVAYAQLDEYDREQVPSFASHIYRASYAHWQVGERAWRFDVPPGCEASLKKWVVGKGGQPRNVAQYNALSNMTPPDWWSRPADARLVSNRYLPQGVSMSMWYSASQNRVWLLYCQ